MNGRATAALRIWRARGLRARGDRAYLLYLGLLVLLVVAAPLVRAVWLSLTSPAGIALLASAAAPGTAALVAAVLWAGALLLGRERGPALLPPFPSYALATSGLTRADAFRSPMLRAVALLTVATASTAALIGGGLLSSGSGGAAMGAAMFVAGGALVGVIAAVAWLAGQALPRAAVPLALGVLSLGAAAAAAPLLRSVTPWGWVGLLYPGGASPHALAALTALTALAVALVAAVPSLMSRIGTAELLAQAGRWDSATVHASGMDFGAAATVYRGRPHLGRRVRAIRPLGWQPAVFLLRDALGAARTPGRLLVGVLAVASAGAILALAFAPGAPGWALGAAAGLVLFAGLGPLTDGVRHAASVASDLPLYGIGDERLLASHALFPLLAALIVVLASAAACALLAGLSVPPPLVASSVLALLAVAVRIGQALKGPLPPALLTPIPTEVGDLGAVARLAWALDGPLLAGAAGISAALLFVSPILALVLAAVLAGLGARRWRRRG
ncbi:hypothetical protein J4H92_00320 [Leucobacter weissii]|uniref:Uncharacterized protein n=1 Tax=Leucobacter weissii TaxID=1983706 RepID=A0A939MKB3_9MICO|nr:hypothetical protein [Leucobacter weissii]MBO1900392.1 hypothetical protein [Leucobacter weissii]